MKKTTDTNYANTSESFGGLDLTALAAQMSRHVTACGVTVSADACAHVLSAMASRRLLYVESSGDGDGSVELSCSIASFLGCVGGATVCTERTASFSDLMGGKAVNAPLSDKLRAIVGTGRLSAVVIDNREGVDLSEILSGLDGYFSDENETREVSYNGQSLVLPKNTYFIFVVPAGKARELIGSELSFFACPIICERLLTLVTDEKGMESAAINAEDFYELCRDAYFRHQPSEQNWRRIDRIDSFLEARTGRGIGNDGYLTMEKYLSVFTACTGDCTAGLDMLLCDCVRSRSASLSPKDAEELSRLLSSMSNDLKLPRTLSAVTALAR